MKPLFTVFLMLFGTTAFAQAPVLLNDFATSGASTFTFYPEVEGITTNNNLFFIADDGKHGEELWRSNGTAVGTQLLKDINPDEENSNIRLMAAIGNTVYFAANSPEHGYELWTTQGTTSSTQLAEDINPGTGGSISNHFAVLNNVFYFAANGDKGTELYRSEGTEASTFLVRDINPNVTGSGIPYSSNLQRFTAAQDIIYFVANDGEHGNELWKTDGTAGGTTLVKDITEGIGSTSFSQFKTVGNTLVFVANDGVHGNELWISLGSGATTYMVKDITEGEGSSTIEILELVDDFLYFTVRESVFRRLWKTDGTEEGTTLVEDGINTRAFILYQDQLFFQGNFRLWKTDGTDEGTVQVADVSINGEFAIVNDILYFVASEGGGGNGLWKTDGTPEGTSLVKEITTASYKEIDHLTAGSNHVFFIAEDDEFGRELWASDGTGEGTFMLIDSAPSEEDGFRSYDDVTFHLLGDKILFAGFDETHGRELWASDGTIEGTTLVKDIKTKSEDIQLYNNPIPYKNDVYFATDAGIWKTDGTAENTVLFQESSSVFGINVFNEQLMYTAPAPGINRTIWTSNGTAEGTQPLMDSASVSENNFLFIFQENLPQINGTLYFSGRDSEHGSELWKTDGTATGTTMVKDINASTDDSFYSFNSGDYIVVNDILYFVAADNLLGGELWKTDGTEAGTVPVSDINPFGSSSPRDFTEIDGIIYFSANDGTAGYELWKTDGTTDGTVLVKDIFPGDEDDDGVRFTSFINFQGTLFFAAEDNEHGKELWKTDGTEGGTVMVKDIYPKTNNFSRSSNPRNFFVDGDAFYFVAQDSTGTKIWKSDGTAEGTQPFLELEASYNTQLLNTNGTIFFTASDAEHGQELWKTDGTPEGTSMVYDIIPGSRDSSPTLLGYINDVLYFTAIDDNGGRELWTLAPFNIQTQLSASKTEICTAGDTITFTVAATDAGTEPTYVWYINDQPVENQNSTTFTTTNLTGGDKVKVQVIADEEVWVLQDSIFSATITISLSTLNPKITIAGNKLTASEGAAYQWFFNGDSLPDTTQSIEALESGNYQVEIKNENGCSFLSDEVEVIVCDIETPAIQVEGFTLIVNAAGKYRWFLDGELLADTTQSIEATKSGEYEVEVTNAQGCAVLSETATIDICGNLATIQIEGTTLTASDGASYQWFFNGNLLPDTTQTLKTEESGVYQVEVTDSLGCIALSEEVGVCTDFPVTITEEGAILTASEGASYQWFLDGELLPEDTQSIAAQQSGTYQVEVTNAQGCVALSEEVAITVTGIEDELLARQLRMYPNPAASHLTINSQMHEEVHMFIYSNTGKVIHETILSPYSEGYEISLHHLTPGLYLVRFIGEKGVHQKKLIKY